MIDNLRSRLGTETSTIGDLIAGISKGETKVPHFQRKFVWTERQALELLDSIARNYPVGSLLLWKTSEKLPAERNIGNFKLPVTDDMSPTDYVLDGQQRLTVIYSCLGASSTDDGFAAAFNLETEKFVSITDNNKASSVLFPLRIIFDTTKLLNFRTGLQALTQGPELQTKVDAIIHAFTTYRLPVVTLKDLTVEEVCPIFERINSSGTKLSTFDLMVAATWSKNFHLSDKVGAIAKALEPKGFGDIDPNTVLKCLSAIQYNSIKKDTLLSLRDLSEQEIATLVDKTKQALLSTVDLFTTEFKLYSWDFLPYEAFAIILAYICAKSAKPSREKVVRVRQWFWQSAFSERYRVGGEQFVSNDLVMIYDFVVNEKGTANFGVQISDDDLGRAVFRSNNSRSRAFILALALIQPMNLTNGQRIDTTEALSIFNKKQFHHIYPKGHLKRMNVSEEENLLLNICMLSAAENNAVSDADPQTYLPKCVDSLQGSANAVFESNLLPLPNQFNYETAAYDDFISARLSIAQRHIKHLCSGE